MEPERFFSFRWHPYALEEGVDYSSEPTTLVTFTLEDTAAGTRLTIVEWGFDAIPESRRAKAFSMKRARMDRTGREHPQVPVCVRTERGQSPSRTRMSSSTFSGADSKMTVEPEGRTIIFSTGPSPRPRPLFPRR